MNKQLEMLLLLQIEALIEGKEASKLERLAGQAGGLIVFLEQAIDYFYPLYFEEEDLKCVEDVR